MAETELDVNPLFAQVGSLIKSARQSAQMTQTELADRAGTSQSAINRVERGEQNIGIDLLSRINQALDNKIITLGDEAKENRPTHIHINGGKKLHGSIRTNTSKNAAVALLCAALLNRGTTLLRNVAQILEVERILKVLHSIGVSAEWVNDGKDLQIKVPDNIDLAKMDEEAAKKTRTIIMFLGPLYGRFQNFELPYSGGCNLGERTVEPHMVALRHFGIEVETTEGHYHVRVNPADTSQVTIVLTERGDTVTENAIMAAASREGETIIRNASPNYMVQDLCFFLERLGVEIDGTGTTTLRIRGSKNIDADVDYSISEDPIEAMTLLTAGIVTKSEITVERVPIEFIEIELAVLAEMGLCFDLSDEYLADNERTRLVDVTVYPSALSAPKDKIHCMPFPGLNIDNLHFFTLIAACAEGKTIIHDWVYDGRAIHMTDLTRLGANVQLLDPHRLEVDGPTDWSGAEVGCPPALRPGMAYLLAMLAARGESVLRNVEVISRGYSDLTDRLKALGADIERFHD